MPLCIFCGTDVRKSGRSKEHILPMWLLKATGDPHRKIRIEFDPDGGADVIRPASTFHFPACEECNWSYGTTLETQAKLAMETLFRGGALRVSQCYRLLDWLDKVRIGLWLGYHMLHKEVFEPKFHIDSRLGKKDRIAIVSVDPNDTFKGFSIGGCDNNVFRTSQACVYLRINNVRILSLSSDSLISALAGAPYIEEMLAMADNPEQRASSASQEGHGSRRQEARDSPVVASLCREAPADRIPARGIGDIRSENEKNESRVDRRSAPSDPFAGRIPGPHTWKLHAGVGKALGFLSRSSTGCARGPFPA
jgi:hypothetical protein